MENNESIIQSVLEMNGIPVSSRKEFLNPNYSSIEDTWSQFQNIQKAVDRVNSAIVNKERILIWGDFDVDGLTAFAIMYRTIKQLGGNPDWHIPDRRTDGHGLNRKNISNLCPNYDLMITVDCGIQNYQEIKYAQYLGCEVILTDHHLPEETLPLPYTILTPPESLKTDFSGAGIAFKFAQALLSKTGENRRFAQSLLWLAFLGTVVDHVEQRNENRIISVLGLKQINEKTPACIRALARETGMVRPINKNQITWKLSPIINSASRLGFQEVAAQILIEEESETTTIIRLSKKLSEVNTSRKELFDKYYFAAINRDEIINDLNFVYIIFESEFGKDTRGLQGILAAKLSSTYENKPAFVFTDTGNGLISGSVRCPNHNFNAILPEIEQIIISGGGHRHVGGLSMYIENFDEFASEVHKIIPTVYDNENLIEKSIQLPISNISFDLYETLKVLEPYEHGDSPLFRIEGFMSKEYQVIGKDKTHIKFQITEGISGFTVLGWGKAEEIISKIRNYPKTHKDDLIKISVEGRLDINNWNNKSELQIIADSIEFLHNF